MTESPRLSDSSTVTRKVTTGGKGRGAGGGRCERTETEQNVGVKSKKMKDWGGRQFGNEMSLVEGQ